MARRPPPPPPTTPDAPDMMRMMELVITEASQRQYLELLTSGTIVVGPSSSSSTQPQEWSLENFLQHRPAKFNGQVSPDEADRWFRDMEHIFNAKRCSYENRLAFTEYLLSGEASHWWSSMRTIVEGGNTQITWELFKERFYAEYFPDSVRFPKEIEFLQLVQGNISVFEYADRFKHLIRFHTVPMSEVWQCRKFENGLRGEIKLLVKGLSIKEFPALVEMARVMEKTKLEVDSQKSQPLRVGGPVMSRGGSSSRRTPYSRPPSHGSRGSFSQSLVQSG
ncbi:uncharacterized protein LOC108336819 [Vigna angularis]|uniref:uncharacterized protein LOC108336819 n=1 Tax=Phaseolus angularis TaxID=3914 RepID=UPI00080A0809|nr:uncharacterized protein LOC108336819 [Vigna angularis]